MKKLVRILTIIFIISVFSSKETLGCENPVKVNFFNTGRNDCILLQSHSKNILIDTGDFNSYKHIEKCLEDRNIIKIDIIIITNYHKGYFLALENILKGFKVNRVLIPTFPTNNKEKDKVIQVLDENKVSYQYISEGWSYNYETISLQAVLPLKENNKIENNNSLVLKGTIDEINYLFMSNCQKEEEADLEKVQSVRNIDVVKIAHNGLNDATTGKLLSKIKPLAAIIICDGNDNPSKSVETRLKVRRTEVFRTDLYGDIIVVRELGTKKFKVYMSKL